MTYAFSIEGLPDWTKVFTDHAQVWRYARRFMAAYGPDKVYFWRIL